ncbi:MAG: protein ImuA [Sphingopyxis sp.]|uniref:ImuA family protein n=1 Tax=Sphingopyxis sp. TaxID=1908224 RepID=UPI002ABA91E9|nr:protein ImuA [Sphingopyxis sp.]MDZ3831927.1 protein ImuA [Sphingopyxis sp.]
MTVHLPSPASRPSAGEIAALREAVARVAAARGPVLPFGIGPLDHALAGGGLDGAALHEIAGASPSWSDDAAATLFAAGIAARFACQPGLNILWTLTRFDLYAPGLEQAGLTPDRIFYAQGRDDKDVLALAEDGVRDGALACVVAEVKTADQTATRRLQLAASEGRTPLLLYRRYRRQDRSPLAEPSLAMTRWQIGCAPSTPLAAPGIGRARWAIELVRQRGGPPFSLELEACDDQGRLALPAATRNRAAAAGRADLSVAIGHAA